MKELSVCIGSCCHERGSYNVIQAFTHLIEDFDLHNKIDFKAAVCMKQCSSGAVGVMFDGERYSVAPQEAEEFFKNTVLPNVK